MSQKYGDEDIDVTDPNEQLPPDYQEWLDQVDDGNKQLDADKEAQEKFIKSLDTAPF